VRNISLENVNSQKSEYGYWINGIENQPISGIYLKNCTFNNAEKKYFHENADPVIFDGVKINGELIE
jgi:hypothetical protein